MTNKSKSLVKASKNEEHRELIHVKLKEIQLRISNFFSKKLS